MKRKTAIIIAVLIFVIGYVTATPIGGAKVILLDGNGNPLTQYGTVHYTLWTFDENGSIKTLQRGTLKKKFLIPEDTIRVSSTTLDEAKGIARRIHSKTAFIGLDVWIEKDGKVYTLPPESFEATPDNTTLPKSIKIKVNIKEARVTDVKGMMEKEESGKVTPLISGHWYEWRTIDEDSYSNVKIPLLIIHNNDTGSDIFGTVDIGVQVHKYWGPDVTVAFGDQISDKINFDPSSITVKALGRSITDYYAGGDDITVPNKAWGYVWIKGTVHYIYQKEYSCYTGLGCFETGNERYFAKIDRFTYDEIHGNIKDIESGSTLGEPPYNFPDRWMEKSAGINKSINDPVYISDFYGHIYAGTDGRSFNVGIPVGAILDGLSGGGLPKWFDAIMLGFSVEDYASYVMLGHLKNKGPASQVTFYAMESRYKVKIPIKYWYGTTYKDVKVPVGLYVEADSS